MIRQAGSGETAMTVGGRPPWRWPAREAPASTSPLGGRGEGEGLAPVDVDPYGKRTGRWCNSRRLAAQHARNELTNG